MIREFGGYLVEGGTHLQYFVLVIIRAALVVPADTFNEPVGRQVGSRPKCLVALSAVRCVLDGRELPKTGKFFPCPKEVALVATRFPLGNGVDPPCPHPRNDLQYMIG